MLKSPIESQLWILSQQSPNQKDKNVSWNSSSLFYYGNFSTKLTELVSKFQTIYKYEMYCYF